MHQGFIVAFSWFRISTAKINGNTQICSNRDDLSKSALANRSVAKYLSGHVIDSARILCCTHRNTMSVMYVMISTSDINEKHRCSSVGLAKFATITMNNHQVCPKKVFPFRRSPPCHAQSTHTHTRKIIIIPFYQLPVGSYLWHWCCSTLDACCLVVTDCMLRI